MISHRLSGTKLGERSTLSQIGGRPRLLQKYVYELYIQRLSVGSDTFNEISMEASISQSLVSQLLFNISSWSLCRSFLVLVLVIQSILWI